MDEQHVEFLSRKGMTTSLYNDHMLVKEYWREVDSLDAIRAILRLDQNENESNGDDDENATECVLATLNDEIITEMKEICNKKEEPEIHNPLFSFLNCEKGSSIIGRYQVEDTSQANKDQKQKQKGSRPDITVGDPDSGCKFIIEIASSGGGSYPGEYRQKLERFLFETMNKGQVIGIGILLHRQQAKKLKHKDRTFGVYYSQYQKDGMIFVDNLDLNELAVFVNELCLYKNSKVLFGYYPQQLPNYTLNRFLHKGNESCVFKGRNKKSGDDVIIKVVNRRRAFENIKMVESKLSLIDIDNVNRYIDILDSEQCVIYPYFEPIEKLKDKTKFLKLVDSLSKFHQLNLCHCDICPSNLLFNREKNEIVLNDFGSVTECEDIIYFTHPTFAPINGVDWKSSDAVNIADPKYDLISLVKTIWWLFYVDNTTQKRLQLRDGMNQEKEANFWTKQLQSNEFYADAIAACNDNNYQQLKIALANAFRNVV